MRMSAASGAPVLSDNGAGLIDEYENADEYLADWANLTGWTVTGLQVSSNRLYGISGGNPAAVGRPFSVLAGETVKITAEIQNVGSNSGSQYIGVAFGGSNDGVNASLPTFVGCGIGTSNRRPQRFVGANFSTVTTGAVNLNAATLASGTYRATVVVDDESISLVFQNASGSVEFSEIIPRSYAPNGGEITAIVCWNGATNGTSGHYIKALGVKKSLTPFRTKSNAAGAVEGAAQFVMHRQLSDPWRIQLPRNMSGLKRIPVVLFAHQAVTGDRNNPITESRWSDLRIALDNAGYALLSADDGGDRWGNVASMNNYSELVNWVRARVYCGPIFLIGYSMGGLVAWNLIANDYVDPVAACLICPVCDLIIMRDNSTFTAAIDAAWSSSSEATLITNSVGYDPISRDPVDFASKPYLINIGASDTIVPPADHADLMAPQIAPYAGFVAKNTLGTGHGPTACFDPDVILPFFERHR